MDTYIKASPGPKLTATGAVARGSYNLRFLSMSLSRSTQLKKAQGSVALPGVRPLSGVMEQSAWDRRRSYDIEVNVIGHEQHRKIIAQRYDVSYQLIIEDRGERTTSNESAHVVPDTSIEVCVISHVLRVQWYCRCEDVCLAPSVAKNSGFKARLTKPVYCLDHREFLDVQRLRKRKDHGLPDILEDKTSMFLAYGVLTRSRKLESQGAQCRLSASMIAPSWAPLHRTIVPSPTNT